MARNASIWSTVTSVGMRIHPGAGAATSMWAGDPIVAQNCVSAMILVLPFHVMLDVEGSKAQSQEGEIR